ncbi:hypothetical protein MKX03_018289, partial [Papaver bracteatum]
MMVEIMVNQASSRDLKELVAKITPELIGKEIKKATSGIYPLQKKNHSLSEDLKGSLVLLKICEYIWGLSGFTANREEISLLKAHQKAEVDIIDRLPTPFGLVRSGVAPDHQETKVVINQFLRVGLNERCSFFGNLNLGSSVSLSELCEITMLSINFIIFHSSISFPMVVLFLAYGAESDRDLGVPGEGLAGIHSGREFVWWYNGHPDFSQLRPNLKSAETTVVLGQGNVALDVARILLRPTAELATTDIANHALASLHESSIRFGLLDFKVYLVGRRGPAQAAYTAKELRELLGIKDLYVNIQEGDLIKSPADEEELKNSHIQRRVHELLSKAAISQPHLVPIIGVGSLVMIHCLTSSY